MENRWRGSLQFLLGLALAYVFYFMMEPFLVVIFLGAVIAIICYPLQAKLSARIPAALAGILVTVGVMVGVLLPLFLVLYNAAFRLLVWIGQLKLPHTSTESILAKPWLKGFLAAINRLIPIDQEWLHEQGVSVFHTSLEKVSGFIGKSLAGMPGFLLGFMIVMISIYFFLVDGDKFLRFLSSLSPMKFERSIELYNSFEKSCRGVVLG